jgi:hypothetical protein
MERPKEVSPFHKLGWVASEDVRINQVMLLSASPPRTAVPAAHFDRNKVPAISGEDTSRLMAAWRGRREDPTLTLEFRHDAGT